jgi:hypothetical protein
MRPVCVMVVGLSLVCSLARAAEPPAAAPAAPAASTVTPPATDPPDVVANYQRAMTDFAEHRFAAAAAGFDDVAARSADPVRRSTATEMAGQARARIAAPPPTAPPQAAAAPPATAPPQSAAPDAMDAADAKLDRQSRDGRYFLLVGTSVLGLSLYGPTLPVLADSSGKTTVGLYMLGAGGSFLVPYLLTREEPVTWGMADAWWYGSTRGALHGFFLYGLGHSGSYSSKLVMTSLSVGSLAEGIGFTVWAAGAGASPGFVNAMVNGSDFGFAMALGLSSLVLPDEDLTLRWASATGLIGAGIGYGVGWWYGRDRDPTWGDGEVLRTSGLLGAYAAVVPFILAGGAQNRRVIAGMLVAGAAGGLGLGDRLLVDHHFSVGQGIVTELAAFAGAAAGAGLGYLISPSGDIVRQGKIISTGLILGGVGGFTLAYLGLDTTVRSDTRAPISFELAPDLTPGRRGVVLAGRF